VHDPSADAAKQFQVEEFWDARPCDSDISQAARFSTVYFKEIEDDRYQYQPHILELLNSIDFDNQRVLEIGTGVGTDARQIIRLGGLYTGINVDAGSCAITRRALDRFDLSGTVRQASAVDIPYPDHSFDVVYSFGVLHHIPEVDRAIREIYRVLKPGGILVIMLYNRPSLNYQIEIRHVRRWGLRVLRFPGFIKILGKIGLPEQKIQRHLELSRNAATMTDSEWLSRNTDGPDNPYSRVYDADEVRALLSEFTAITQEIHFFDHRHWGIIGKAAPRKFRRFLGNRWGWHRIIQARKHVS